MRTASQPAGTVISYSALSSTKRVEPLSCLVRVLPDEKGFGVGVTVGGSKVGVTVGTARAVKSRAAETVRAIMMSSRISAVGEGLASSPKGEAAGSPGTTHARIVVKRISAVSNVRRVIMVSILRCEMRYSRF